MVKPCSIDPMSLVFVDATRVKTTMTSLRGRASWGQGLKTKVPHGLEDHDLPGRSALRWCRGAVADQWPDQRRKVPALYREGLGPDASASPTPAMTVPKIIPL